MTKYYIIPIDNNDNAYLSVKSKFDPYGGPQALSYCSECPSIFGGNDSGNVVNTLVKEVNEESHGKVTLDVNLLQKINAPKLPPGLLEVHTAQKGRHDYHFYAMRYNVQYNPNFVLSAADAAKNDFKETTGEILTVNLMTAPWLQAQDAADGVVQLLAKQPTLAAINQLRISETAIALLKASEAVRSNKI